jgi:hypothetical protein
MIEMDSRLGHIVSTGDSRASVSFVDDDSIATYYLSRGTDNEFVVDNTDTSDSTNGNQTIAGPRGTMMEFKVQSSLELNTSTYLFTTIGQTETFALPPAQPPLTTPLSQLSELLASTLDIVSTFQSSSARKSKG